MKNQNQQQVNYKEPRCVKGNYAGEVALQRIQQQDKATPRPWKIELWNNSLCITADGLKIASFGDNGRRDWPNTPNAALIVKAVNEHDALVAVAREAESIQDDTISLEAAQAGESFGTAAERTQAISFYKSEIHKAKQRLSEALAALASIRAQQ